MCVVMDCPFTVRQGSRARSLSVSGQSGIYSKNPTVCYEAGGRRLCSNLQAPVQHLGEVGQPLDVGTLRWRKRCLSGPTLSDVCGKVVAHLWDFVLFFWNTSS